ncbi:MAG: 2-hydroxychromene-2-carboxylate isomerase [Pseudomonadota bacterium]
MANLEFFFEFASTYSYPAAMRIEALAAMRDVDVVWRPFLLGPLFHEQQGLNDSPFNVVPEKGEYMWRDMERICKSEGLPFRRPDVFPQNGLRAARVAVSLPNAKCSDFTRKIYTANFAEVQDISDLSVIADVAGYNLEDVERRAADPANKRQLRDNTERAKALGVFGAPSFTCTDGELFWGNDRLEASLAWASSLAEKSRELV